MLLYLDYIKKIFDFPRKNFFFYFPAFTIFFVVSQEKILYLVLQRPNIALKVFGTVFKSSIKFWKFLVFIDFHLFLYFIAKASYTLIVLFKAKLTLFYKIWHFFSIFFHFSVFFVSICLFHQKWGFLPYAYGFSVRVRIRTRTRTDLPTTKWLKWPFWLKKPKKLGFCSKM